MKAIIYKEYGSPDVLMLKEVEQPAPRENELLVRIYATTVNRTDCGNLRGTPFIIRILTGLFKPSKQIMGTEFAGDVVAIGKDVTLFKVGDKVFGFDDTGLGAFAEYTTIAEDKAVTTIPEDVTYAQAAASSEGAHYGYNFINKVPLKKGDNVLVNGG